MKSNKKEEEVGYPYMTKGEFEVFSPLYYCCDYEEYKKHMNKRP